jgi:hypothetical protein
LSTPGRVISQQSQIRATAVQASCAHLGSDGPYLSTIQPVTVTAGNHHACFDSDATGETLRLVLAVGQVDYVERFECLQVFDVFTALLHLAVFYVSNKTAAELPRRKTIF